MLPKISSSTIHRFRKRVYEYFARQGRDLPWRRKNSPYFVLVSEIMLQQTQVDRVVPKFELFVHELPDFSALARAPVRKILRLWQGLGYNRRALNLKRAAEIIIKHYGGKLPSSPEILQTLPGIGKATAASIAAFAFNTPTVFLETNIRTVLIHHFFSDRKSITDDQLLPIAGILLDRKNPAKWYSALMDYGTMLKKQYGNASRRSAHYTKQSRFEGSRRQKRGMIIRLLLEKSSITSNQLSRELNITLEETAGILDELIEDGIITKSKGSYAIA